jgi:wyosine [tRNA(Phe)-imidazoG37] synthetase (radical SAM superfamily)
VVVEDELSLVVDAPSSLLLLQEMMVKLKRNMEKMMSICLTRVPISGLGEPKIYQNLGDFSRIVGFYFEGV